MVYTDFSDAVLDGNKVMLPSGRLGSLITHTGDNVKYLIQDSAYATGGKELWMEVLPGQDRHARLELTLNRSGLGLGDEYYYKARIYISEYYDLTAWNGRGWHSLTTPVDEYQSGSATEWKMRLGLLDNGENFEVECAGGDWKTSPRTMTWGACDGVGCTESPKPITILKGDFNTLEVYVKRHETDGIFRVKWNGEEIFNFTGVRTKMKNYYNVRAIKLYGGEITHKWFAVDTFEVVPGSPEPPPEKVSLTVACQVDKCSCTPAHGIHEYDKGATVSVYCIPLEGWYWVRWLFNGAYIYYNPAVVTLEQDSFIQAYLQKVEPPPPECPDYNSMDECEAAGCSWYNNGCHEEFPTPEILNNETDCTRYGWYWYNGACHADPNPDPCFGFECPEGYHCEIVNGEPVCVQDSGGCAAAFLLPLMGLGTLLPYLRQLRSQLPLLIVNSYYGVSSLIMEVIWR